MILSPWHYIKKEHVENYIFSWCVGVFFMTQILRLQQQQSTSFTLTTLTPLQKPVSTELSFKRKSRIFSNLLAKSTASECYLSTPVRSPVMVDVIPCSCHVCHQSWRYEASKQPWSRGEHVSHVPWEGKHNATPVCRQSVLIRQIGGSHLTG